ncbi:protoporphyrinogen/coproporphyrinogen oxidase [Cellulomonas cellasea]|uniref:Protoporphyrinogen oxidase n=1 Tax=Cellulomonas cellasea TaxID=43670 RepID=A0A4Y3KRD8_9CELL|nr:FAD-dependent oxidoreductase [Cellulomonas cellasea]GEA86981.1 protoporphyrinogen oxidase [Cellulomonas cellasea]
MERDATAARAGVADADGRATIGGDGAAPHPTGLRAVAAADSATWGAVVVGGGVAGLVAARELARAGVAVLVLERGPAPGGAVGAHEVAGLTLDTGAESFATRGGSVAELAGELGLAARVVLPEPLGAWVQLPGLAGPLPRAGHLGIPADPWAEDVRRTIGRAGALRASLDRVLPAWWAPRGDGATLGALVRVRFGRRVLDRLVRPVVAGVMAADPDDLAADAASPGLRAALAREGSLGGAVRSLRALAPAGSAVASFDGGMHVLVDALVADVVAHGGVVRTRADVTAVRGVGAGGTEVTGTNALDPDPSATRGRGVTSGGDAGSGGTAFEVALRGEPPVTTERLVLATPAAPELLAAGLAPGLAGHRPDPGADVVLATLVLDAPELDAAPRGTGVLVTPDVPGVRAKALTHASAKWAWVARAAGPGRHVVRLSYGVADRPAGTVADDPRDLDPAALTTLALRDAATLLGVPLRPEQVLGTARVAWSQSLPRPSAGHRDVVTRVRVAVEELPGLAVCGAWVAGNGLASVVPDARRAARSLLGNGLPEKA